MKRGRLARRLATVLVLLGRTGRSEEAASPPPPAAPRWVPTVSLGVAATRDRLALDTQEARLEETRGDLRPALLVGLAHPVAALPLRGARLDGHLATGLGVTTQTGRYLVPLREDVTVAARPTRWLTLRAGLGASLGLDLTRSSMSEADVAVPLGIAVAERVELVWRPRLVVPLGSERRAVFGGARTSSVAPHVAAFDLALRVRIPGLGF